MARKKRKARRRPLRRRNVAARRKAPKRTMRSAPKRRVARKAPKRRNPKRRVARKAPKRRVARRRNIGRRRLSMKTPPPKKLSARRGIVRRRNIMRRRNMLMRNRGGYKRLMRNGGFQAMDIAKSALRVGAGLTASMIVAQVVGRNIPVGSPSIGALLGNVLTAGGFVLLHGKVGAVRKLDPRNQMAIGAGLAAIHSVLGIASEYGLLPASIAQYVPGMYTPVAPIVMGVPAVDSVDPALVDAGTGAYIQQAALYGSPIEQAMQHSLRMQGGGMSGGIFDHKTTLGEYDLLETAPAGTNVQRALADYEMTPGMGASVRQATAGYGMGATVQEAFAGPSLKEYVSVPLSDYVGTGGAVTYWSQSPKGQAILGQIRNAARKITAARIASGQPVDAAFKANLTAAAVQAVKGQAQDVSMAAPASPLTLEAAPFPGSGLVPQGNMAGEPGPISMGHEVMDDDDSGIFG